MLSVLMQMATLLTIVAVGFFAHKRGLLGGEFDKRLSAFIIDISCPCLIVSSVMGDTVPSREFILPLLAIGFVTYVVLYFVALWLPRLFVKHVDERGLYSFMLMFGNVGFLGYPVVAAIFGPEAVFYASLLNASNTLFVFIVGAPFVKGEQTSLRHWDWHTLFCPGLIASYVSIALVLLDFHDFPLLISRPITLIGAITVPGALLVIGSSMADISVKSAFGKLEVYIMATLRLLILPVFILFFFRLAGLFFHIDPVVININAVVIGMPVASFGTMFCLRFGRDETVMVQGTLLTTFASALSIPLLTLWF